MLRNCKQVREVWDSILEPDMKGLFFQLPLHDWIKANLSSDLHDEVAECWDRRFCSVVWWLRKWRNGRIFNDEVINLQGRLLFLFKIWTDLELAKDHAMCGGSIHPRRQTLVKWKPLFVGCWKLNMDGACKEALQAAGGGGVIFYHERNWLFGFFC